MSHPNSINWTKPMLARFKRAYKQAVKSGATEFSFDQHEFHTAYAGYLQDYLDGVFNGNIPHPMQQQDYARN